jgi:phosphopentomutase
VRDDVAAALRSAGHVVESAGGDLSALRVDGAMIVGDNLESDPLQTYHTVGSLEDVTYEKIVDVATIVRSVARVRRIVAMGGRGFRAADVFRCTERRPTGQCGVNNVALGLYTSKYVVRHLTQGTRPDVQVTTLMHKAGWPVALIGKVADVIVCEGAEKAPHVPTGDVLEATFEALARVKRGLIAINVQETDLAGHDQNAERYAACLRITDAGIGRMLSMLTARDLFIVTGDHGNDPTIGHDKHTREFTPLIAYSPKFAGHALAPRESLADIAMTIAENFGVEKTEIGTSFPARIADEGVRRGERGVESSIRPIQDSRVNRYDVPTTICSEAMQARGRRRRWTIESLKNAVECQKSLAGVLRQIGLRVAGSNYENIRRVINANGFSTSHWTGKGWLRGRHNPHRPKRPLAQLLVRESTYYSDKAAEAVDRGRRT